MSFTWDLVHPLQHTYWRSYTNISFGEEVLGHSNLLDSYIFKSVSCFNKAHRQSIEPVHEWKII